MNNRTRHAKRTAFRSLAMALLATFAGVDQGQCAAPEEESKSRLLAICASEQHTFTPKVRQAFLVYAKSQAQADLKAQGKSLPEDFLAWVDADPETAGSVYGAHDTPSQVLLQLYSLRLDLGRARFVNVGGISRESRDTPSVAGSPLCQWPTPARPAPASPAVSPHLSSSQPPHTTLSLTPNSAIRSAWTSPMILSHRQQ